MKNKIRPIKYSKKICFKCLKKKENIHTYSISYRGYGSGFDNVNTMLQLCDDCNHEELDIWFNEEPELIYSCWEDYKYEDNIFEFINNLPIQGREMFENQCASGACNYSPRYRHWIGFR